MKKWTDEATKPDGFATDKVELLRDFPELGIVLTLAIEEDAQGKSWLVKTWDRATRQCIRCRRAVHPADAVVPYSSRANQFPSFTDTGGLIYLIQQDPKLRKGRVFLLPHDELVAKRILNTLKFEWSLNRCILSKDGQLLSNFQQERSKLIHAVYCLQTGKRLWKQNSNPPAMVHEETASFSPCGTLIVVDAETSVQSGSDFLSFAVLNARTGEQIMSGESSVYVEWLRFSDDGQHIKLEGEWGINKQWPIPPQWQRPQTTPPLAPNAVKTWEALLVTLKSFPA